MISPFVLDIFLRQVPSHLAKQVSSGKYQVFGSVIRNVASGRIVGFLQEAAPLAPLLANPATAVPAAAGLVAKVALQSGQLVQGETIRRGVHRLEDGVGRLESGVDRVETGIGQIQNKLDDMDGGLGRIESNIRFLDQLGLANLAMSAASIGISVVGFTVMAAKLDRIKQAIHGLADQIDTAIAKIDLVQQDILEADFAELKALSKSYDEGWLLGDVAAERRWQEVAQGALRYQTRFESRADHQLGSDAANYLLADPMLDAVSFASGLRVAALAASNETIAARVAASDGARSIERLTGSIGVADLSRIALGAAGPIPGTQEWTMEFARANEVARDTVRKIRHREAAAFTRAAPLASLERRGIHSRDWLEAAREEKEAPVLLMLELQ